jgi:preprotein translocase subunit SecD
MKRVLIRKTLLILAIILASVFVIVRAPLRLGLDLRGGVSLILRVKAENVSPEQQREVLEQTRQILERRINAYGLSEAPVQPYGSKGNELMVQIPGITDASRIRDLLQRRGVLEWYAVEGGPYTSRGEATAQNGAIEPSNRKWVATRQAADGSRGWYVLDGEPIIRGTDLRDARSAMDAMERPVTTFTLSQNAAARFEQYTQANIGRRAAIVLDDEILSAPIIENEIRGEGQIRGARNYDEAENLAVSLRSGALPASVEIVQERIVEASLGADSIRRGLQAGAAGLAAVVAVMLLYYRWAGANATLALLLNGLLLLAVLSCFGAVLTLPGIAGAVLTIGMAVDSNVLIFERIREELRARKSASAALAAGFAKAFATLVDTHVTTVVSCTFLLFFGTPSLKGFSTTLVIGLTTNLFTSVFVSRVAFDWDVSRRRNTRLSVGLAR